MQLGHNYIGTEHLLLGIIREGEGVAAQIIMGLGVDLGQLRRGVLELMTASGGQPEFGRAVAAAVPRCPRCGASLVEEARYRMVAVASAENPESGDDALSVPIVYCNGCGTALGSVDRDRSVPIVSRQVVARRQSPDLAQLAAEHVPSGPPPEDEETARTDIGKAFAKMGERSADGAALVYVERGENLGPCSEELQRRFPQYIYEGAGRPPEMIKFLSASESVVWMNTAAFGRAVPSSSTVSGRSVGPRSVRLRLAEESSVRRPRRAVAVPGQATHRVPLAGSTPFTR
jgi:hypothetical protein